MNFKSFFPFLSISYAFILNFCLLKEHFFFLISQTIFRLANMRLTSSLWQQHIARMFKKHWHVQHKRRIVEMGTEEALSGKNIKIIDPKELFAKPLQINK